MIDVLLGLQFGDEGKGKIVDTITSQYDIVARFGGGCNAGHTLVFNGEKHVLHLIPSGIFHDCINVIGNGCVIDPISLMKEIKKIESLGIDVKSKLLISNKAHVTLPEHILKDKQSEESKGDNKIGTTLKGIGPTYSDKISRKGNRLEEILNRVYINDINNIIGENASEFINSLKELGKYNIINTEIYLNTAIKEGKSILAEGAQGTLLDVDFGTYPYVTSSNTCIGGVMTGLGVPPQKVKNVIGICKAYTTRVGSGPFVTELNDELGEKLRKVGNEFGSTTGRPRRCGWLDLHTLRYSCMINGVTEIALTKLDVLSSMDEIKICVDYDSDNNPVYETFSGWHEDISKTNMYADLPENCKKYITFVQTFLETKVSKISIGSDRKQIISTK